MIEPGLYKLKDVPINEGIVEITHKDGVCDFFWGTVSKRSSSFHDGKSFPFDPNGRYIGCQRWAVPDLEAQIKRDR